MTEEKMDLNTDKLSFTGIGGPEKKQYSFELEFNKPVKTDSVSLLHVMRLGRLFSMSSTHLFLD